MRSWLGPIVMSVLVAAGSGCGSDQVLVAGLRGRVSNDDGAKPPNAFPTASFVVTPESGTTQTVFQFDASGSSDIEDAVSALQVRWDWENDGTWDTTYSVTKTAAHQYGTAGTKTIKLEVKDTGGLTGTTIRLVAVTAPTVTVTVQPPTASVQLGGTQQFTATVEGTSNTAVTWSVDGGASEGAIDSSGLYTAPATVPSPATVTVRATSIADPSKSGTAQVTVTGTPPPPGGFVLIQPSTFTMGSPSGEPCRYSDETQHQVTLTRAFYVSTAEVTQAEWQAAMGRNPSSFTGPNLPVETITWFDAVQYCNAHSIVDGLTPAYTMTDATYDGDHISSATVTWNQAANGWRLLTEAEWEYACRAGSTAAFCNGGISQCHCESEPTLTQVGWFCGNSGDTTHDVGTRSPNAWGLYDMHGNVWELCWDRYEYYGGSETDPTGPPSGSLGVIRGGSWSNDAPGCRSAVRSYVPPGSRYFNLGLRLARTVF